MRHAPIWIDLEIEGEFLPLAADRVACCAQSGHSCCAAARHRLEHIRRLEAPHSLWVFPSRVEESENESDEMIIDESSEEDFTED